MQLAVLDTHERFRKEIVLFLRENGHNVILEDSPRLYLDGAPVPEVDVLLFGFRPEISSTAACIEGIRKAIPETSIICCSDRLDEHLVFPALEASIRSFYITNDPKESLLHGLEIASTKGSYLSSTAAEYFISTWMPRPQSMVYSKLANSYSFTKREKKVVELLLSGNSYKEIAAELHVSINTVRYYVKNIYRTMEVGSRKEMASKLKEPPKI